MKIIKTLSRVGLLWVLLTGTAASNPWSNSLWDDNDWPEWTPMYWMEAFFGDDDDDFLKDYYRYRMLGMSPGYASPYSQLSPYQAYSSMASMLRARQGLGSMMPGSFGGGMSPWQMYSPMNSMSPWSGSPLSGFGSGFPMQTGMLPMMSPMGMGGMNPMTSSMMSPMSMSPLGMSPMNMSNMGMGGMMPMSSMNPMNSMYPMSMTPFSGLGTGRYFPRF